MAIGAGKRDEEVRNPASLFCEIGNFRNRVVACQAKIEESGGPADGMNFVSYNT